ncbi:MAG: HIT family protein [Corticimicrobacter sp.]|uniref:HIT family protein n=1 Tax=Corticimicrobacter sp. TaxID=2678536 RepID=UPI0032DBCCBB
MKTDCIFCQIANRQAPSHILWEDDTHMAILSIYPNTPGFSVVLSKRHRPSYIFELEDQEIADLMKAARHVAKMLDAAFDDVGRTGCMMEGFGVDHAHVKLFPMHGTKGSWRQRNSDMKKYFEQYEGYISSHDCARADDAELAKLAQHIRKHDTLIRSGHTEHP